MIIVPFMEHTDFNDTMTISEKLSDLKVSISALRSMPTYITTGEESFSSFFKSVITSIVNVIMHVINLFKTNLFKSYLSLKRTELRYYVESNVASVRQIHDLKYTEISDMEVPYPTGMTVKYLDGISVCCKSLAACDIVTKSKLAVTKSKSILDTISKGVQVESEIVASIGMLDPSPIRQLGTDSANVLNTSIKSVPVRTFGDLFVSMSDMKKCEELLLSGEPYIQQTALAHKNMAECYDNFSKIIKQIENAIGTTVSKSDVEHLATLAYNIAETFDIFATSLNVYHVLEHNLVEVYKELRRQYL